MSPPARYRFLQLQLALLAGLPCVARAEPIDVSIGLASATVIRGIAVGEGGIDAHATASVVHPSGWSAMLGVAALHAGASSWDTQSFARLGHTQRLDDDWSLQLAYARYAYPGSPPSRRYGYDELGGTLAYRDLLYASIAGLRRTHYPVDTGRYGVAYDLVARQPLPWALMARLGLGRVETSGSSQAYAYGDVGLGARLGATQAQLSYIATDAAAKRRYGDAASNRWTASLDWTF